jgi:S-adenosyl methyltransferase
VYDYWLGGKDNYAADRVAGEAALEAYPDLVSSVRANRAYLARVVRYLAGKAGIRQFLDIGTGIPTANNTRTRSPRRWRRKAGSFMSTTTRSSSRTPAPC